MDLTGLGTSPLQDSQGNPVWPQPTHRPRSPPNDKYVQMRAAQQADRPVFPALLLQKLPVIDGRLDEWSNVPRKLLLSESIDRTASPLPASRAWIGYDDQALYIAAQHPAHAAASLKTSPHLWAQCPGMEIVFQAESAEPADEPVTDRVMSVTLSSRNGWTVSSMGTTVVWPPESRLIAPLYRPARAESGRLTVSHSARVTPG